MSAISLEKGNRLTNLVKPETVTKTPKSKVKLLIKAMVSYPLRYRTEGDVLPLKSSCMD
jgi:hypothetical protein